MEFAGALLKHHDEETEKYLQFFSFYPKYYLAIVLIGGKLPYSLRIKRP